MKIDSVMTMEVKTRNEELEELLAPDGVLNKDIFEALQLVVKVERDSGVYDERIAKAYETFDNALNRYLKYAIEYDRLKRSK